MFSLSLTVNIHQNYNYRMKKLKMNKIIEEGEYHLCFPFGIYKLKAEVFYEKNGYFSFIRIRTQITSKKY